MVVENINEPNYLKAVKRFFQTINEFDPQLLLVISV